MAFSYVCVEFAASFFLTFMTFHVDIYFLQSNTSERAEALALRDAVLSLRRNGAFVAVPLWRVNLSPIGPHPAGKPFDKV